MQLTGIHHLTAVTANAAGNHGPANRFSGRPPRKHVFFGRDGWGKAAAEAAP